MHLQIFVHFVIHTNHTNGIWKTKSLYLYDMGKYEKLLEDILIGKSDSNLSFEQVCKLLTRLGFSSRIKGSHHIFYMDKVDETSMNFINHNIHIRG